MAGLASDIFSQREAFHAAFANGLQSILGQHSLGAFILACANASGQAVFDEALGPELTREYQALAQGLNDNNTAAGGTEDLEVFHCLQALGLENLPPTMLREILPWHLQFNAMRAFRPMRHAASVPETLQQAFDPNGFHFNKPFMLSEQFWEGQGYGHQLSAYYNKYPFADYHLLWVPDREQGRPQYLERPYHDLVWSLSHDLNTALPGFAMAYNALGAYASVNHLHFQSYLGEPLPVTRKIWRHNGGNEDYPLAVMRFEEPDEAWRFIETLHHMNQPYNLLYSGGEIYCIPRLRQGSHPQPDWSPGFAWRELCGDIVTAKRDDFDALSAQDITTALGHLSVTL
jgi:hypothetical protein